MKVLKFYWCICAIILGVLSHTPSWAQQDTLSNPIDTAKAIQTFGGPSSVGGQISSDQLVETKFMSEYFDFKNHLTKQSGFSFGIDYFSDFQAATSSLDNKTAFSGVFRTYGSWDLVGRQSGNTGSLIFKFENRHVYGHNIAGQDLGFDVGYIGLTAIVFSDVQWVFTNLYWEQKLLNNKLSFVVGIVDATDYLNIYSLADPWTAVSNLNFSTGATLPVPSQGLGLAVRGLITDNVYVLGGIEDANGDPSDPLNSFDSFFRVAEFLTHLELGWIGSYESRFTDNIHITYWHVS